MMNVTMQVHERSGIQGILTSPHHTLVEQPAIIWLPVLWRLDLHDAEHPQVPGTPAGDKGTQHILGLWPGNKVVDDDMAALISPSCLSVAWAVFRLSTSW